MSLPDFARHVSFIEIDFYELKKVNIKLHDLIHDYATEIYNKGEHISLSCVLDHYESLAVDDDDECTEYVNLINDFLTEYYFHDSDVRVHWDW